MSYKINENGKYYKEISNIVDGSLDTYQENAEQGTVEIAVRYTDVNFDLLEKLAHLFNTRLINIGSETRNEGYCETCSYEYSVVTLFISGVKF